MEKGKNKNGVIALLIVIIIILALLCYLFATDTISLKSNTSNNNQTNEKNKTDTIEDDGAKNIEEPETNKNAEENDTSEIPKENNPENEPARLIVNDIMDKFYNEVFLGHKETYCGDYDNNDTISIREYNYHKSATYNNLNDLKEHLNTYMTTSLIDYILGANGISKYQEKDNKLYCLVISRGGLIFDKDNTTYSVSKFTDDSIIATANISALAAGGIPTNITANLEFIKIDNTWLLSKYEEKH